MEFRRTVLTLMREDAPQRKPAARGVYGLRYISPLRRAVADAAQRSAPWAVVYQADAARYVAGRLQTMVHDLRADSAAVGVR